MKHCRSCLIYYIQIGSIYVGINNTGDTMFKTEGQLETVSVLKQKSFQRLFNLSAQNETRKLVTGKLCLSSLKSH